MFAGRVAALVLASAPQALDPAHLPALPARGLARQAGRAVVLETLNGRSLGREGFGLAIPRATHGLLLSRCRDRLFALDPNQHRLRRVFHMPKAVAGCRLVNVTMRSSLLLCGRRIELESTVRGGAPTRTVVARAAERHV